MISNLTTQSVVSRGKEPRLYSLVLSAISQDKKLGHILWCAVCPCLDLTCFGTQLNQAAHTAQLHCISASVCGWNTTLFWKIHEGTWYELKYKRFKAGMKCWQQTKGTVAFVTVLGYTQHWHFYKTCHITFTLHIHELTAILVGGGDGCGVTVQVSRMQAGEHSSIPHLCEAKCETTGHFYTSRQFPAIFDARATSI